jgi:hypothetical protein
MCTRNPRPILEVHLCAEVSCRSFVPICRAMRFRDHAALQPSARSFEARLAWAAMGTLKAARKCMGAQNMYSAEGTRLAMVYAMNVCA